MMLWNTKLRLIIILSAVSIVGGCARQSGTDAAISSGTVAQDSNLIELPKLTKFRPGLDDLGRPSLVNLDEMVDSKVLPVDDRSIIEARAREYLVADHAWALDLIAWWEEILDGLDLSYHQQGFDCEDYSRAMALFAELAAVHSGYEQAPVLFGVLACRMAEDWHGVSKGGLHATVLFHTDQGLFVTEPQTGRLVSAADYPAERVYSLTLF